MTNRRVTARGFSVYGELLDSNGAKVDIIESSRARVESHPALGPWIWVFINGGGIAENDGAAHLDVEQATAVRDALTAFIDENQP